MNVDLHKLDACKAKIVVSAEADEVRADYDAVVKQFMKQGQVQGFRPGKAPLAVIKQKFGQEITENVQGRCFRALSRKAVAEVDAKVIELTNVTDMLFSPETGCSFVMEVEIAPTIVLPRYKKIVVGHESVDVTEEAVDARLAEIRAMFAKYEDAAQDHCVEKGDLVAIDFNGELDGTPLIEFAPAAKAIAEGKDFWVQVEEGKFIQEIQDAILGLKAGESPKKKVVVKFPKDHAIETLRNEKAQYSVTVKTIRARVLPTDEEFVKIARVESLDALRTMTREQLESQAKQQEKARREQEVVDALLKKADFDVPFSQVRDEVNVALQRMSAELQQAQASQAFVDEHRKEIIQEAEAGATRTVRLRYLLLAVAKEEQLTVADADVDAKLAELAPGMKMSVEQLRAQVIENERMETLKDQILAGKAMDLILAQK